MDAAFFQSITVQGVGETTLFLMQMVIDKNDLIDVITEGCEELTLKNFVERCASYEKVIILKLHLRNLMKNILQKLKSFDLNKIQSLLKFIWQRSTPSTYDKKQEYEKWCIPSTRSNFDEGKDVLADDEL